MSNDTPNDAARPVAIHQFRHKDCQDWYDARPEELPEVVDDPEFITRVVYIAADYDKLREEVERLREECSERQRLLADQAQNVLDQVAYGTQQFMRAEAAEVKAANYRTTLQEIANFEGDPGTPIRNSVKKSAIARRALNAQGESNG